MPVLFSYGSLQEGRVQLSTFGRLLSGQTDELVGFERTLAINDPKIRATLGTTHHANAAFTGNNDSHMAGMAFDISDAELAHVDGYEAAFSYVRVATTLASGKAAWVYVRVA